MTSFIVGDTDQLLFRFQGSNPKLLASEIERYIPSIQTVKLEINYRSMDEIINKSQQLIRFNYSDLNGPYEQELAKETTGIKGAGGIVDFEMYATPEDESYGVSTKINELLALGYKPGDFFIGARTRAQLGYVEGALIRAGIKFINITGNSFWQSKHVSDVVDYLRLAYDGDKEAFKRVNNIPSKDMVYSRNDKDGKYQKGDYCPTRYLGAKFLQAIGHDINKANTVYRAGKLGWRKRPVNSYKRLTNGQYDLIEFVDKLKSTIQITDNVAEVIQAIINNCYEKHLEYNGVDDEILANAKLEDLATVKDLAKKFTSVDKFLSYVNEMIQAAEDTKNRDWSEYVVLSTYHALKGLERLIVFGLGWCEGINVKTKEPVGLLPYTYSMSPPPNFSVLPVGGMSLMADERSIGFVCISRAIERCYLSGIENYRNWTMKPSRFIKEMELV